MQDQMYFKEYREAVNGMKALFPFPFTGANLFERIGELGPQFERLPRVEGAYAEAVSYLVTGKKPQAAPDGDFIFTWFNDMPDFFKKSESSLDNVKHI
jgi:hypothetical protein